MGEKLKVLELFAGIGACSKALTNLGVPHKIVDAVEIDKYAIKSFNAVHGTNFEPQDITQWDKDLEVDLIMHGSPCQDFSVAGLGKGGDEGSGTRSSLLYETLRIVEKLKPKYVIWENVKAVISAKHKHNFDKYQERMTSLGYTNYYQVLNAKDYGVPQNRERVFTVSVRSDLGQTFSFPTPIPLTRLLKDVLDEKVDEKYYLSEEKVQKIRLSNFHQEQGRIQEGDVSSTLLARDYKDPKCVKVGDLDIKGHENAKCIRVGGLYDTEERKHQAGAIYSPDGVAATLDTMSGGNREPIITEPRGFVEGAYQDFVDKNGYIPDKFNPYNCAEVDNTAPTQTTQCGSLTSSAAVLLKENPPYRIRKLTPKECWRLMGFADEDFEKAEKVNSNSQLYKQAGNSIVVDVLSHILNHLVPSQ